MVNNFLRINKKIKKIKLLLESILYPNNNNNNNNNIINNNKMKRKK